MVMQRIVKPKTQRGKRFLETREPKIHENTKTATFIKGGNTSETITQVLKELYILKKPNSITYKRKNILRPFEDETPLIKKLLYINCCFPPLPIQKIPPEYKRNTVMTEYFAQKNDSALFVFGSHSKKRPHNIVVGRMFDYHVLDMVEFGIEKFHSIFDIKGSKCAVGTQPGIIFAGDIFDQDDEYKRIKNLFLDFFRGTLVEQIRLAGLEHVVMITAVEGKIYIRNYRILLKKSGSRTPRIELEEMGPSLDLVVRRTKLASDDLYKRALRVPKTAKPRRTKNISKDPFGSKLGRIHMQKQDLSKLQTRKLKGLKRKREEKAKTENAKKSKPSETV